MVYWYLVEETDERIIYEYYPENKKDKKAGIITIDRIAENIELTKPAEYDIEKTMYENDLRMLYNAIAEVEEVENVEEIIARSAGKRWWVYYEHAERRIFEDYNNGIIKKEGMTAWY